jgi:hypothetical protein
MRKLIAPALIFVCLIVVGALHFAASASNDVIVVTREDDPPVEGCQPGDCTLREAVDIANSTPGRQEIQLPDSLISLQSLITLSGDMSIVGTGPDSGLGYAGQQIVSVASSADVDMQDTRIFNAHPGDTTCGGAIKNDGTLKLTRVSIDGNTVNGTGAGLCNNGSAQIIDSSFDGNSATGGPGGAIFNTGTMTITGTSIHGNTVTGVNGGGDAGGIWNAETGTLNIDYSTISGNNSTSQVCQDCSSGAGIKSRGSLTVAHSTFENNSADDSAAIQASGATTISTSAIINNNYGSVTNLKNGVMTIANSTISNNLAGDYPKSGYGGLHNEGSMTVVRSTIADNTAIGYPYGGFFNSVNSSGLYLRSNLIANNGTKSCSTGGFITSQGGNVMTDDSCGAGGQDSVVPDAKLAPLADNGGPTKTRALLADSPAIDHGSNYQCVLDQRGAPRPVGSTCDAGAFEYGGIAPTLSPSPSPSPVPIAFPMGDADCSDKVNSSDVTAELRLALKLDSPSDCGRSQLGCMQFDGACFPVWTNPDCNESVDAADVLPILMYLVDSPLAESCTQVGQYPES